MSESSKYNRIQFDKKEIQKGYIINVENILGLNDLELAKKLEVCLRTIRDWKKEKITISQIAAEKISKLAKIPIPKDHTIIDWKTHWQKAGTIGAKVKFARYGKVCLDEEYRKEKWREWWNKVGKYRKPAKGFVILEKIKTPRKSKLLAEFIGILLGDGHIARYQVTVTLSSEEKQYINYVRNLIKKLFGIVPGIAMQKRKAITIVISRKLAVDFCQKFGFEIGNKVTRQVDIPDWIKENETFSRECIRGLFDTDGCFFNHGYIIAGKKYAYLKIAFTSASAPLRLSVQKILINLGFNVRMSGVRVNSNGRDIRIDDARHVARYIKEIGSHNQKHIDKIEKWRRA